MNLRIAPARRQGLTEEEIAQIDNYEDSALSEREKVAIRFGEMLAADHLGIDDALIEDLHRHFSEPEIVELTYAAATFVGFGRALAAFGLTPGPIDVRG